VSDTFAPALGPDAAPLLAAEGLEVSAAEGVVGPLDLTLRAGDVRWLSTPAGAAKPLAMRALLGLQAPSAGRLTLLGRAPAALPPREALRLRRRVGFVPQRGALLANLDLHANLALLARHHLRLEGAALEARLDAVREALALPALRGRRVPDADPSLARRVAIGRVWALRPPLLLLEEPSWAIDAAHAGAFWAALAGLRQRYGVALLIASAFPPRRFVDDMTIVDLPTRSRHARGAEPTGEAT
jgi:ABC-type transporter Mla maintaining outer membrane lipid asymmetry ATPase subunit MlaF